jgi:hypothetical protein
MASYLPNTTMPFLLYRQTVSQIQELKIGYASGRIGDWAYKDARGKILDHYICGTDLQGNPNVSLMMNRLHRLSMFSHCLAQPEVFEEKQRLMLQSQHPASRALGRPIPLMPAPILLPPGVLGPSSLQQEIVVLPPPRGRRTSVRRSPLRNAKRLPK